jgi:hypothetical protein
MAPGTGKPCSYQGQVNHAIVGLSFLKADSCILLSLPQVTAIKLLLEIGINMFLVGFTFLL